MSKKFTHKPCKICREIFTPFAPCNTVCTSCQPERERLAKLRGRKVSYAWWARRQVELGRESVLGVGKGGSSKKGKESPEWTNGVGSYSKVGRQRLQLHPFCERCQKSLSGVNKYQWCTHHKDHDRTNNNPDNLEVLCKSCHQKEHNAADHLNKPRMNVVKTPY